MNSNEMLLVFISASLVLLINWRALAAHKMPAAQMARLALLWLIVIIALALLARLVIG